VQSRIEDVAVEAFMLGTSVVACERLMDEEGIWGYYFIFVDLSFRAKGKYRLRFDLYDLAWYGVGNCRFGNDEPSSVMQSVYSNKFEVYIPSLFPGMSGIL
jgi:Velvet factor